MIKVLIVEDSPVIREFLTVIINSDPQMQVIGTAADGEKALEAVRQCKPDIVTMDIHMPKMDGLEATRKIMETNPVPIVIVSGSVDIEEVKTTFRAMEAGAIAAVQRPKGIGHPEHESTVTELIQTVKLMSEVKVVKRWARLRQKETITAIPPCAESKELQVTRNIRLVAIGASTGGPPVLQTILSGLPKNFPVPVMIVQHIVPGFLRGFVEWLGQTTGFPVLEATQGKLLLPGNVYIAPDGVQMGVSIGNRILLSRNETENGLCPSVSYLFSSVQKIFGAQAIGILLTGMGKDGAEELKLMRDWGAITIAQDEESSVVYGMPGEAVRLGGACHVLKPEQISETLVRLIK